LRTFLAYDVDDPELRSKVEALQSELRSTKCDIKLVDPAILHFTMRFFGETTQEQVERVITSLKGNVENFAIDVEFKGVGAFPNERRISVIWIGTDSNAGIKLREQSKLINSKLLRIEGLRSDEPERFSPHLTIARVRSAKNKQALVSVIESNRDKKFGVVQLGKLKLKMSELFPSGPKYTDLYVFE
jgi:2'-5' RNA ligase